MTCSPIIRNLVGWLIVLMISSAVAFPAIQISTNNENFAGFANDNDPVTCSKTGHHSNAWWSIDLGSPQVINEVTIKGTIEGSPKIYVEEDVDGETVTRVCAAWHEPPTATTITFPCIKPLTGSRIRISARARRYDQYVQLELCDVTVA